MKYPNAVAGQYLIVAAAMAGSLYAISHGLIIEPPAALNRLTEAFKSLIARRFGAFAEPTS
jgi:hypothetical protein